MSAQTILEPHESEFEVGSYQLGHRHPYEAIILTLNGEGFSLAGKNGLDESQSVKLDWQAGHDRGRFSEADRNPTRCAADRGQ
jgi:hypothetical protein